MNETLDEIFGRIYKKLGVDKKVEEKERLYILNQLAFYDAVITDDWMYDIDYLRHRLRAEETHYSMRRSLELLRTDRMIHYGGFYGPTLYDERSAQWWVDQAERIETQQCIDESIEKWTWGDKKEYKHNGAL